jgi:hypothetical protein
MYTHNLIIIIIDNDNNIVYDEEILNELKGKILEYTLNQVLKENISLIIKNSNNNNYLLFSQNEENIIKKTLDKLFNDFCMFFTKKTKMNNYNIIYSLTKI